MKTNRQKEIFKRFYTGIQSKLDEKELLEAEEVNRLMENQWEHPEEVMTESGQPDFDAIFNQIEKKAYKKPQVIRIRVLRLVAGIAILAGLTIALYLLLDKNNATMQLQFSTVSGETRSFELPDGTNLWLGPNSRISYAGNFTDNRILELEGLAFFEVKHNKTPFRVDAGILSVEVTGTAFSVSNYKDNPDIEVVLVKGIVNISGNKSWKRQLKPNEKFVLDKNTGQHQILSVNARELTLWKEKKLIFNNSPLTEIADSLSNRFGITFHVDPNAAQYNFTFSLSTETIEETLSLISSLAPIGAKQANDTTFIFSLKK